MDSLDTSRANAMAHPGGWIEAWRERVVVLQRKEHQNHSPLREFV